MDLLGIFVAGGTGGHVFPACATAEALKKGDPSFRIIAFTDARGLKYWKEFKHLFEDIIVLPVCPFKKSIKKFTIASLMLGKEFFQSIMRLRALKPHVVWGFGGYATAPTLAAARVLGVPCGVHEANAYAGRVNRILYRIGAALSLSFPKTLGICQGKRSHFVGLPLRKEALMGGIVSSNSLLDSREQDSLYTPPEPRGTLRLAVMGGSQGASFFTHCIPSALQQLPGSLLKMLEIWHQCPQSEEATLQSIYHGMGVCAHVSAFWDQPSLVLHQVHLVITRAGASSLGECIASGRPMVPVPLPSAKDNHQFHNAVYLVGRDKVYTQGQLRPEALAVLLQQVHENPEMLRAFAHQLCQRRPWFEGAAQRLAILIKEAATLRI